MLYGRDTSHYQKPDWKRTQSEGYSFGLAKVGGDAVDPTFKWSLQGMLATPDLIPGGYWFLRPANGAQQVHEMLALMGHKPDGLLMALDVERGGSGQMPQMADVEAFVAEWKHTTNHPLGLYLPSWYWALIGRPTLAGLCDWLWSSRYPSMVSGYGSVLYESVPPSYWNGYGGIAKADVLQFSSTALVAGEKGDVNAFLGTADDLRKWTVTPTKGATGGGKTVAEAALTDSQAIHKILQILQTGPDTSDWIWRNLAMPARWGISIDEKGNKTPTILSAINTAVDVLTNNTTELSAALRKAVGDTPIAALDDKRLTACFLAAFKEMFASE